MSHRSATPSPTRVLVASWLVALLAPAASADWITFVEQTSSRLQVAPDLGAIDVAEKTYAWGDLDRDGHDDLVVVRKEPFTTPGKRRNVLLLAEGGILVDRTTEYATASDVPADEGFLTPTNDTDVLLTDIDLDGWLDVVTATTISDGEPEHIGQPRIYRNRGNDASGAWLGLRFENARIPPLVCSGGQAGFNPRFSGVAAGDLTGDGYPELYFSDYDSSTSGGSIEPPGADFDDRLLINQGAANPGHFVDETASRLPGSVPGIDVPFPVSDFGVSADIADVNGDGRADIVKQTTGTVAYVGVAYNALEATTLPGNFDSYAAPYNLGTPYFVSSGDLNGDDRLDLVVTDAGADRYLLNLGNGTSGTAELLSYAFTFAHSGTGGPSSDDGFGGESVIADMDNDGWNDVLIVDIALDVPLCSSGRLHVYRNLGGTPGGDVGLQEQTSGSGCQNFQGNPPTCTVAGIPADKLEGTFSVAVLDINEDGWKDLVVGRCAGTAVYLNAGTAPGAGQVPDGHHVAGSPLRIGKAPNERLVLSWGASCFFADSDYEIYEGTLGDWTSHVPATCTTGGSLSRQIVPGASNGYYLIVPRNASVEGSYGTDGTGGARPPSVVPCLPQSVSACG